MGSITRLGNTYFPPLYTHAHACTRIQTHKHAHSCAHTHTHTHTSEIFFCSYALPWLKQCAHVSKTTFRLCPWPAVWLSVTLHIPRFQLGNCFWRFPWKHGIPWELMTCTRLAARWVVPLTPVPPLLITPSPACLGGLSINSNSAIMSPASCGIFLH